MTSETTFDMNKGRKIARPEDKANMPSDRSWRGLPARRKLKWSLCLVSTSPLARSIGDRARHLKVVLFLFNVRTDLILRGSGRSNFERQLSVGVRGRQRELERQTGSGE